MKITTCGIVDPCRPDQLVEITLNEIDVDCTDGLVMVKALSSQDLIIIFNILIILITTRSLTVGT